MNALTSYEHGLIKLHPNDLTPDGLVYLADPLNADFLGEYEETWRDVIEARRPNRRQHHAFTD